MFNIMYSLSETSKSVFCNFSQKQVLSFRKNPPREGGGETMIMDELYKTCLAGFEQLSILKYDPLHGDAYIPVSVCSNEVAVLQNDASKSSVRNKEDNR